MKTLRVMLLSLAVIMLGMTGCARDQGTGGQLPGKPPEQGPADGETLNHISELRPNTRISSYLGAREQMQELYNVGVHWDRKLGLQQDCKSQHRVQLVTIMLHKPIKFPAGQNHPTEGIWQHRFQFQRCGANKIYNAIFIAKNGEKPEMRPYFPGTTATSIVLLKDAMIMAVVTASAKLERQKDVKGCKDIELIDTEILKAPRDVTEGNRVFHGVWSETWTFRGCSESVAVDIQFVPDGRGGTNFTTESIPPRKKN